MGEDKKELICIEKEIITLLGERISQYIRDLSADLEKYNHLKDISDNIEVYISETSVRAEESEKLIQQLQEETKRKDEMIAELDAYKKMAIDSVEVAALLIDVKKQQQELEDNKTEYVRRIKEAEDKAAKFETKFNNKENEYDELDQKHNDLIISSREKIVRIEKTNQDLENKVEELEEKIKEKDKEIADKKRSATEESKKLTTATKKILELEKKLSEAEELSKEISEKDSKIERLNDAVDWLRGYAIATDRKVVDAGNGNSTELDTHREYLINGTKDNEYEEYIGVLYEKREMEPQNKLEEIAKPIEEVKLATGSANSGFDDPA